ncbi:hypothetical protein GCM10023093_31190 [Nemorincola caseinilytica]|uniref:Secretion system C-terminal sorting domain-containing protein n=1 Tax=Nemorincola caseinilytica TaxID=2054315 RepID=A0ABP8NSC1_9BACT
MKKILMLLASAMLATASVNAQTTATDFTINDCSGVPYHLFEQLDAGKIIVVSFVMPCVGCIAPSQDAQNVVSAYGTSHPGRVVMYLADDEAATPCSSLMAWRNANGLPLMPTFSNTAFVQAQYGTPGMPKIVVLGGTDHRIYGIQNDVVDIGKLYNDIDAALGITTLAHDIKATEMPLSVYPNPATDHASLAMTVKEAGYANIQVVDNAGRLISTDNFKTQAGNNKYKLDLSEMPAGIYAVKVTTGATTGETKLVVRK